MRQSVMRIGCFVIILGLMLSCWDSIFELKYEDGIYGVTKFYELDGGTVDVLILGSSHAFVNFNTGTLWDEFGMASYDLGGSVQPMWNTYYYLKEALKTQRPKLIVLEGFCTTFSSEYTDDSRIIKNNYGLHWSKDKVESLKVSTPKERWAEFFLEYTQYHSRYKEITPEDFCRNRGNPLYADWKGLYCMMATTPLEHMDISGITDRSELYGKTETYYRATVELAQENDIPIIVVISPYARINDDEQKIYNRAEDIAAEMNIPFVNCNLFVNEIGMDYATDAADTDHLNYKGNQKFSRYIGQYLVEHYDIPDRRGDEKYASWDRQADFIRQMIYDQELVEMTDAASLFQKIKNTHCYWTFLSVDGSCNTSDENVHRFMANFGIAEEGSSGMWYFDSEDMVWSSGMGSSEWYQDAGFHNFHLKRSENGDGTYTNTVMMDNVAYKKVENGVNVIVYDTVTEKIADAFGLNADDGFAVVR